jgi:hypothetical protein
MTGGTNAAIDGTTSSYTGTLNLTSATITGNGATAVSLTGSTLGGSGSSITNAGPALVLSSVALTNGTGMSSVTSSAGVNGISLTSVTGGTYTISGGSLSGNSSAAFFVSGGSATVSYAGNITSGSGHLVDATAMSGGGLTFSGALGGSSAQAGLGIRIRNSTNSPAFTFSGTQGLGTSGSRVSSDAVTLTGNSAGTTTSFNGSSFTIFTSGTARGMALGAGTTNVSATTATIDTADSGSTCGGGNCSAAIDATNTVLGMTFQSINVNGSNNHVPVGLRLDTTSGSFIVSGDGTGKANGSGGSVNVPSSASSTVGLGTMYFRSVTGTVTLKSMNVSMTNNTFEGVFFDNNSGGGTLVANVTGGFFSGVTSATGIQSKSPLHFEAGTASGTPTVTVNVQNSYFQGSTGYGFFASTSAGQMTVTVNQCGFGTDVNSATTGTNNPGSTITNPPAIAMAVAQGVTGSMDYTISNNTMWGSSGAFGAIWALTISGGVNNNGSVHMTGTVNNNMIGKSGVTGSGCSTNCGGIGVLASSQGTFTATVTGNTVQETNSVGIGFENSLSSSTVSAIGHITNNTVGPADTTGSPLLQRAIFVKSGLSGGANTQFCIDLTGNTLTPAFGGGYPGNKNWGSGGSTGIRVDNQNNNAGGHFKLPGYGGAATDTAAVAAFVAGNNTMNSYTVSAATSGTSSGFIGGAGCP